jgi:NAD(P)-dependent dehydrogenase (short-subunit alcohol dehydrogenase family)
MNDLSGKTTLVVGASRGLGRGIVTAFAEAGAPVVAVSRSTTTFPDPANNAGSIQNEVTDGGDPTVPATLLDRYQPRNLLLVAGASPHMRPLHQQTWETFSVNWETDVRLTFQWLREALLTPLEPGSRVIVFSSGAAIGGSPLSGGYAGAKATQRFITRYAQDEANRAGLDLTFTAVLPALTPGHSGPAAPLTGVGEPATKAYAARAGRTLEEFVHGMGPLLTPEVAGAAMVELAHTDAGDVALAYLLTADGLEPLP